MTPSNGSAPQRPDSPRPGALTAAQARDPDTEFLWVHTSIVTPQGQLFCLLDPRNVKPLGEALLRFAELDQVAEKRLIVPE